MQNPIYQPKGAAGEYAELALNIYQGCPHGCTYCYVPGILRIKRESFHSDAKPRPGIIEATRKQLEKSGMKNETIMLCFTCDPYPVGHDSTATREIIKLIKSSGNHVKILTKGDETAQRDFDLMDGNDWFGVTWSWAGLENEPCPEDEPGAAHSKQRFMNICAAKRHGLNTWLSCELVIDPSAVTNAIPNFRSVDMWMIGKLNHRPSLINWANFGEVVEALCQAYGRNYYIKADLRKAMQSASGFST